jgi:DNA-3-methyladenine glycosylase
MAGPTVPQLNNRLPRGFYTRPAAEVARDLLGQSLVRVTDDGALLGGKIVETEAYLAEDDPASHSAKGPTRRNRSMFQQPGTLYVYTIHAKYCMNVSTDRSEIGSAVLIRAIEPLWGIEKMALARGQSDLRRLTRGPAMLCQALGITTAEDGIDLLVSDKLAIISGETIAESEIAAGPRIGISRAIELPLRFYVSSSPFKSR